MNVSRTVKYEEELDADFANEIAAMPGGEKIWDCIQCGTCSAICPVSVYMDKTPRRIIGMIRAGFKDEVLSSVSPWICTSCYSCTVECPADIKITDIMYSIKRMAMEQKTYRRFVIPDIEDEFVKMVWKNGRLSEAKMGIKVARKSGLRNLISMVPLAWKLSRRNRLKLFHTERMANPEQLRIVLNAMQEHPPELHVKKPGVVPTHHHEAVTT